MELKFLLCFLLLFGFKTYSQDSFFVSSSGNDMTGNGSIINPWKTIQYGCNQLTPGDILEIRAGVYTEKIDLDVSGTLTNYITIRNYDNEEVILDAINFNDYLPIIYTDNAYLRIEGLHLTNNHFNFATGLALQGAAHHIDIINNKISHIQFSSDPNAIVTFETNAIPLSIYAESAADSIHEINIIGNEVFNNINGFSENISAGGNFSTFLIEDNIVHDNTNIGIDVVGNYLICPEPTLDQGRNGVIRNNIVYNCNSNYATSAGIYVDGGKNIIIENNISFSNGYGAEIGAEESGTTSNIILRNNLFYNNFFAGLQLGGYNSLNNGSVNNSHVYNNTFYKNDFGANFNGEMLLSRSINCRIENNIFYVSSQNQFFGEDLTQTGLIFDYNLVFADEGEASLSSYINNADVVDLSVIYSQMGFGSNNSFGNPLFINESIFDFHILDTSPAIDAGNPLYQTSIDEIDLDGELRVNNGIIDCGVDEYYSTINEVTLELKAFLQGPYDDNDQMMNDGIRSAGYLPLTEPFSELGFIHLIGGGEQTNSSVLTTNGDDAIVDWIFIELRGGIMPNALLATQSALVQRDGDIVGMDGSSSLIFNQANLADVVYVVVKHRNHFGVKTLNLYDTSSPIIIDFTDPNTPVFGSEATESIGSKMVLISGDANNDGQINAIDKNIFWRSQNSEPFSYILTTADFNLDGITNSADRNLYWRINNAKSEQID